MSDASPDPIRPGAQYAAGPTQITIHPIARDIIRDPTGQQPWEKYVNSYRPDGSLAEQTITNRDGSAIRAQYAAPEDANWDERYTVTSADGAVTTCESAKIWLSGLASSRAIKWTMPARGMQKFKASRTKRQSSSIEAPTGALLNMERRSTCGSERDQRTRHHAVQSAARPEFQSGVFAYSSQSPKNMARLEPSALTFTKTRAQAPCVSMTSRPDEEGLTPARMLELASTVQYYYPGTQRIIVTEVRPRR